MNKESHVFDGSLTDSLQRMAEWRHKRYGITSPKPIMQKLRTSINIFRKNKLSFFVLLFLYFVIQTVGNAGLLVLQWVFDKNVPEKSYLLLVQLTAKWPIRILRSFLNAVVTNTILLALKRKDNKIIISDILTIKSVLSIKFCCTMFINDILLASPISVAITVFTRDPLWGFIYLIFGFVLNWFFGFTQILLFENPNLTVLDYFVWSISSIMTSNNILMMVMITKLLELIASPLIITTPVLLVLEALSFYEVFGFATSAEVNCINQPEL